MKFQVRLTAMMVALVAMHAHAADFSALTLGQAVPDNVIKFGQVQLQLPEGKWEVVSKIEARAGTVVTGATPTQQTITVARTQGETVSALLIFRTPASTFQGITSWRDDPCSSFTNALVKDTMKQNFSMPECFAIQKFPVDSFTSSTTGTFGDVAKWLKASQIKMPADVLRVFYTKYWGGDFVVANMYLPGTAENFAPAEAWGRGVAQAFQRMVSRDSPVALIPPLP